MHILILSDFFPPQVNAGAENMAFEVAYGYVARDHKVTVITINKSLERGKVIIGGSDKLLMYQIGFNYNEKFSSFFGMYNPFVLSAIEKIVKKKQFSVAHIHNIHAYISYGVISLLNKYRIPAIMTAHDAMSVNYGKHDWGVKSSDRLLEDRVTYKVNQIKVWIKHWKRYNPFRNVYIKYQLKKLNKVVCVSRELERLLNANGILNTQVLHNGIAEDDQPDSADIIKFKEEIGIDNHDRVLLFAGRVSLAKGIGQAELLLRRLVKNNVSVKLLVVGGKVSFNSNLSNHVINTEWLSKKNMNLAYSIADITLVPSIYLDPFPTVVLESMRAGTPVIASVYCGAKEAVVDGVTGYTVNPFNIDDFSKKVIKILDDRSHYDILSQNSIARFNDCFTINQCVDQYLPLLH